MLRQAAWDLRRFHRATSRLGRELYLDAHRWLVTDDFSSPFSFINVCATLHLSPEKLRQELISQVSAGTFAYWMRRCAGVARRFQLSRLSTEDGNGAVTLPKSAFVHESVA